MQCSLPTKQVLLQLLFCIKVMYFCFFYIYHCHIYLIVTSHSSFEPKLKKQRWVYLCRNLHLVPHLTLSYLVLYFFDICYFSHACNSSSWFWLWKCMDMMKATLIIIKLNNNRITYPLCRAMFLILIIILSSLYNHSYFLFWKFWGRSWQKKARRTWTNYRRNLWRESQRRQKIFRILPRSMRDSRVLGQFHLEKLS